jgi:hypothetical protein
MSPKLPNVRAADILVEKSSATHAKRFKTYLKQTFMIRIPVRYSGAALWHHNVMSVGSLKLAG